MAATAVRSCSSERRPAQVNAGACFHAKAQLSGTSREDGLGPVCEHVLSSAQLDVDSGVAREDGQEIAPQASVAHRHDARAEAFPAWGVSI